MPKLPEINSQSRMKFFGVQRLGGGTQATVGRGLQQIGGALQTFASQLEKADLAEQRLKVAEGTEKIKQHLLKVTDELEMAGGDGKEDLNTLNASNRKFFQDVISKSYDGKVLKQLGVVNEQIMNSNRAQVMVKSRAKQNENIKQLLDKTVSDTVATVHANPDSYAEAVVDMNFNMRSALEALDLPESRINEEVAKQEKQLKVARINGYTDQGNFEGARFALEKAEFGTEDFMKFEEFIDKSEVKYETEKFQAEVRERKLEKERLAELQEKNFINYVTKLNQAKKFSDIKALRKLIENSYKTGELTTSQMNALEKEDTEQLVDWSERSVVDFTNKVLDGQSADKLRKFVMDRLAQGRLTKKHSAMLLQRINKSQASSKGAASANRAALDIIKSRTIPKGILATFGKDALTRFSADAISYFEELKASNPSLASDPIKAAWLTVDKYVGGTRAQPIVPGLDPLKQDTPEEIKERAKELKLLVDQNVIDKEEGLKRMRMLNDRLKAKETEVEAAKAREGAKVLNEVLDFESMFGVKSVSNAEDVIIPFRPGVDRE